MSASLVAVVLSLIGANSILLGLWSIDPEPEIICHEPQRDFGSIESQPAIEHSFVIKTVGTQEFAISWIESGCQFTRVRPSRFPHVLSAGSDVLVNVWVDLTNIKGALVRSIVVHSNDQVKSKIDLTVNGIVTDGFTE